MKAFLFCSWLCLKAPAHQWRHINTVSILEIQFSALLPCSTGKACLQDMSEPSKSLQSPNHPSPPSREAQCHAEGPSNSLLTPRMQECCLQLWAGPTEDPAGRAAFSEQHLWHHPLPLLLSKTMQPSHYCMHGRYTLVAPASLGMEKLCTMQSLSHTQWCKENFEEVPISFHFISSLWQWTSI